LSLHGEVNTRLQREGITPPEGAAASVLGLYSAGCSGYVRFSVEFLGGAMTMQVGEAMSESVLTVGPGHTLREVATLRAARQIGSAVVNDPESPGPGIITERDIMLSLGAGESPDEELVGAHMAGDVVFASPDWSLPAAAEAMLSHGFRHLAVVSGGQLVGMISMRDLVRCYVEIASAAAALGTAATVSER